MPQSKQAYVQQLLSLCSKAHELQLLKPTCLDTGLHNKKSHLKEKPADHKEEEPLLTATREVPSTAKKIPRTANKLIN